MEQLIRQFAEKTPVHLLNKHRQHMRRVTSAMYNTVFKSVLASQNQYPQCGNLSSEDCFMTGSTVEGASLARLFSPDSNTASEAEFDIMISFMEWPAEVGLTYVHDNKAFIHIAYNSEVLKLFITTFGKDAEQKLFCQKEDGIYMSSPVVQTHFRKLLAYWPEVLNNVGFRSFIANKRCEAGNAAMTIETDDMEVAEESLPCGSEVTSSAMGFASREARKSAQAADKVLKLLKEMIPCCEEFKVRITELLQSLQKVQKEFMEMRSEELSLSVGLYSQATKALEWAMICLDITDVIYDTRESTIGRYLREVAGMNAMSMIAEQRQQIKRKLKIYIDQLAMSEDDMANVSVAAAVSQLLTDIECTDVATKGFLLAFQELVKEQERFRNMITYFDKNPQLAQIPEPLQQLSGIIKRWSIDIVPCLKLVSWPSPAADWRTRDHVWPHQSVIDDIAGRGAHLVAKEFCHDDIDWRLSFSVAEIDLATRWSPVQHFVYFVFKSLFYKFIKPLASDVTADVSANKSSKTYLASYTAKTVMMWTSESVEQSWWTEDNAAECLTVLLLALQSAFECRTLDHYFVSSVNLLQGLPDVLASRVVDTISSILADPAAVVCQLESHFVNIDIILNAMPAQVEFEQTMAKLISAIPS